MAENIKTLPTKPELTFKYIDKKDRTMVSLRLSEALISKIEEIAEIKGCTNTGVIQYALDQFVQVECKSR